MGKARGKRKGNSTRRAAESRGGERVFNAKIAKVAKGERGGGAGPGGGE
jgi:hypothetical protein